jgi:ribosomal protein S18 acetylase RimI-like enzyme
MLSVRPATESDLEFLTSLRRRTMWVYFEKPGVPIDEGNQVQRVLYRFDCAKIVTMDGEAIGLFKAARDVDPWHLMQIQLLPAFQGQGLGGRLIADFLDEARVAGMSVVLGVLRANPARRLYERLGFRVVGQSEISYEMRFDREEGVAPAALYSKL